MGYTIRHGRGTVGRPAGEFAEPRSPLSWVPRGARQSRRARSGVMEQLLRRVLSSYIDNDVNDSKPHFRGSTIRMNDVYIKGAMLQARVDSRSSSRTPRHTTPRAPRPATRSAPHSSICHRRDPRVAAPCPKN